MPNRDIVVIGASAGGIEALTTLAAGLPRGFPAAVFVVLHMPAESPGILPDILTRAGVLPALNVHDGEIFRPGHIYVALPDHHLLVEPDGHVRVTRGPKENRFRPAVDPLFRSAVRAFGPRVIGVILTGGLDDGTAGIWAVKRQGGTAVVQDPADAAVPSMPANALKHVRVDYCVPLSEIAPLLARLTGTPAEGEGAYPVSEQMEIEVKIAGEEKAIDVGVMKLGAMSPFTCPECHGSLLEMKEEDLLRFRCHTGHAFTVNSLLADLTENVEDSLWTTIRSIEESAMLMSHMAEHLESAGRGDAAALLLQKAREAQERSDLVRQAARRHEKFSQDKAREGAEES